MKRLLLLLVTLFTACNVFAAELKVGIVNLDVVLSQSPLAMQMNQKMSSQFQPKQDEINAAQKKLQDSIDQFTFTSYKLSQQERTNLQTKIANQRRDLEAMSAAMQKDFAAIQAENTQNILNKLNTIITKIAKDGNYDMIMSSANLLYLNTTIDITQQVVTQLK